MKFAIITHTPHFLKADGLYAYGPYVKEMNIWAKHVDELLVAAPISKNEISDIHSPYQKKEIHLSVIPPVSVISLKEAFLAIFRIPFIMLKLFSIMRKADHIHLRCPGTIGLIGCWVQIFFPKKPKTAKYAGNWDPDAKQPRSYRIQKWLLSNTFLTRNMQVLVYGEWPEQTRNIRTFFTASYSKDKIPTHLSKEFQPPYRFLFVGSLSPGKRPVYSVEIIKGLREMGIDCSLDLFGDGTEREPLEQTITDNHLNAYVRLHGNQSAHVVEEAYRNSHFLLLPSKSEGWPKVVTESMFWGVIPMVTSISCVPWMLGKSERGLLLKHQLSTDIDAILKLLEESGGLKSKSEKAANWSRNYTLESFELAIKELLV